MTKAKIYKSTITKRKSTVVSSQTYRRMVEEALESSSTGSLDLHGIYESLAERYEQYREDSVKVDWRNSIRHCLSINDNFIRVLPEAVRLSYFPTDPDNSFFYRIVNNEVVVSRSFWTTAKIIEQNQWTPFIMNTSSNVRKAINMKIVNDSSEILPLLQPISTSSRSRFHSSNFKKDLNAKTTSSFNVKPYTEIKPVEKVLISKRHSITDMLVSEWIDPSSFLEISTGNSGDYLSNTSSPLALVSGNQAAMFNMAVMDEDDRMLRMRHKMKTLQQTMPHALGPLKIDFINVQMEKEPAYLPSPMKEEVSGSFSHVQNVNGLRDPNCMISLPPIFNHII